MRAVSHRLAAILLVTLAQASGCVDPPEPEKEFPLLPTWEASQAARDFMREFPNGRIRFSQHTGEVLWIDGSGTPLAPRGRIDTPGQALGVVQGFLASHPNLYRISAPSQSISAFPTSLRTTGKLQGIVTLRFEQVDSGHPIDGKYGIAFFNPSGDLLGLVTQLLPTDKFKLQSSVPSTLEPTFKTSGQPLQADWMAESSQAPLPSGRSLRRRYVWKALEGGGYRVLEERLERDGLRVTRSLRDPETGAVLRSWEETRSGLVTPPPGWQSLAPTSVAARDLLNRPLSIPSTRAQGAIVLGFSLEGIHASGHAVTISDAGGRSSAPAEPIASDAADWVSEPAYIEGFRQAAQLAGHLETTLRWFDERLHHASWDGKGSTLRAGIRGHLSQDPSPELNAWGGGGIALFGDGLTGRGQAISDALDVVAHEFTHSVIDATAEFEYHDEPGALSESLADIFGKSVEGFPDTVIGRSAGAVIRDIQDPARCAPQCSQPDHYSGMKILPLDQDHGGVHANSGILSRALTKVILDDAPVGQAIDEASRARAVAVSSLILGALKQVRFATNTRLEEFAGALSAYCRARELARSLDAELESLGDPCGKLEAAFEEAELLRAGSH